MFLGTPTLKDLPLPVRTPRLLIRGKQAGDGALTAEAVSETWDDLHRWMQWAEDRSALTPERIEQRNRQVMEVPGPPEVIELIGVETVTGQAVVWCGLHDVDWSAHRCDTGFWVRKTAHGRGMATEAANAMLRYAFQALGCGVWGSRTPAAMRPADELRRSSGSASLKHNLERIFYPKAEPRTGSAMRGSTPRVCRHWK